MKRRNYYLIIFVLVLLVQMGMYFTIDSRNLIFIFNLIILFGVVLAINKKLEDQIIETEKDKKIDDQVIEKDLNKKLAKVSETLGFDIQQLLWLSKGNIQMFNKIKEDNEIIFGVNPFTKPDIIKKTYVPILEGVCKTLDLKARTIILKDYDALIDSIATGIIDIGWFSPFAYINAKKKSDIDPLVSPKVNGKDYYNGYIITLKNNNINTLNGLRNKHFGYVDVNSASGYLYANYVLETNGLNPDKDFSRYSFLGSHDNVIQSVLSGEVDAGATYDEVYERMKNEGFPMEKLEIIAKSDDIPKDAIAASSLLDDELKEKLKEAFVNYIP